MNYGVQKCIWAALGDITANFIQGTLVIFVLGSFFLDNPNFLNTFKWIGIIYLMYLAYDIYKHHKKDKINTKLQPILKNLKNLDYLKKKIQVQKLLMFPG